jgi:cell division control protein 6
MSEILDPEDPVPISGWPMDVIFEKVLEKLDEKVNRICFLILDEIDVLIKNTARNQDGIIYNLIRINERLKKARVSVIGISNVLNFKNMLDSRVLSSLSQEEIVFPAYDANELSQILSNRAQLAFHEGSVEDDVIPLCAALAAKEHGDARKALDLLRRAAEIAERRNAPKVISEFVYMAQEDLESDKVHEFIENLPPQLKTILLSIYLIQKHQNLKEIITGDVYNCYLEIYPLISGLNKLTQRRVSELVRELDLAGIINARVVSKGRYGRSKMIQLNITTEEARKCLETDKRLCDFLDYHPICLKETGVARFSNHTFQKLV